jgi:hypothetical protein
MDAVQKIRRCQEDKTFTRDDGPMWPMSITKGGASYGFCPGKATWSNEAADLLGIVEITYYTKSLFFPGSISEQPSWYIELIKDMMPYYEGSKSAQRQQQMWGGSDSGGKDKGGQRASRASAAKSRRR